MVNNSFLEQIIVNDILSPDEIGRTISVFSAVGESSEHILKIGELLKLRTVPSLKEFDDNYITDMDGLPDDLLFIAKRERLLIAKEKIKEDDSSEDIVNRKQFLISSNLNATEIHRFIFDEILIAHESITNTYLPENDGLKESYSLDEAEEYIDSILETSIAKNVSDIHIKGKSNYTYEIAFRIDGEMGEKPFDIKSTEFMEICIRILKFRSGVDVTSKEPSQDGQFETVIGGKKNSWRFAAALQDSGLWYITIRKAHKFGSTASFAELGYHPKVIAMIEKVMLIDKGMVLICGKPGTGKTTLLYMTLLDLARKHNKVVQTIENPVEQRFDELGQFNVSRNYSFADAIRSCTRLNADILLIGEIRDVETARAAFDVAATGMKAFSTVHAGTVMMAPKRLIGLNITELDMAETISSIFAQRFVATLCANCKIELDDGTFMANTSKENACPKCSKKKRVGYLGKRPINEVAIMKDDILKIEPSGFEDYIDYVECLERLYKIGEIDKITYEVEVMKLGEEING